MAASLRSTRGAAQAQGSSCCAVFNATGNLTTVFIAPPYAGERTIGRKSEKLCDLVHTCGSANPRFTAALDAAHALIGHNRPCHAAFCGVIIFPYRSTRLRELWCDIPLRIGVRRRRTLG